VTAEPCEPCGPCELLLAVANVAVYQALDYAGKRMVSRARRGEMLPVPTWTRHTRMQVWAGDVDRLLAGAWTLTGHVLGDRPDVVEVLDRYVRELLVAGQPHEVRYLRAALLSAGLTP
jgi:hypothetical protein